MKNISIKLSKCLATVFYTGYSPFAPGTAGTLAGLVVYYFIRNDQCLILFTAALSLAVGFVVSDIYSGYAGKKDPSEVVIDEFASIFLVFLFIPFSFRNMFFGFLLFRIMDIVKPFPAKNSEKLPGGIGIMTDDIIAALYSNLLLRAILYFM